MFKNIILNIHNTLPSPSSAGRAGLGQRELHPDQEDQRGGKSVWTVFSLSLYFQKAVQMQNLPLDDVWFFVQVAELYEDLRTRVAQFNMKVSDDAASPDYSTANRERFILQARDGFYFSSVPVSLWIYPELIFFQLYYYLVSSSL